MASFSRSLIIVASLGTAAIARLLDGPLPEQTPTTTQDVTVLPKVTRLANVFVSSTNPASTLVTSIASSQADDDDLLDGAPITTLITSISTQPSDEIQSITDQETFSSIVPSSDTTSGVNSVTRYILPSIADQSELQSVTRYILSGSLNTIDSPSVTRYILPESSITPDSQSVTDLESFPWILPDSITSDDSQSVTNLESFPWIYPDTTTSDDIQSVTNLESFPWIYPDTTTSGDISSVTNLESFPWIYPDTFTTEAVAATNLETFPTVISDDAASRSAALHPQSSLTPSTSSTVLSEDERSASSVVVSLSSGLKSDWSPVPTQNLSGSTATVVATTFSIATLTPLCSESPIASVVANLSNSSPSAICQYTKPQCPVCNGSVVQYGDGPPFQVYCDAMVLSSKNYMQVGSSSAEHCLTACKDFLGCGAASLSRRNNCLLSVGSQYYLSAQRGEIGFLALSPNSTTSSSAVLSSAIGNPSTATPSSVASKTRTIITSQPSNLAGCTLTDFNCPRCNLVNITDSDDQPFRILCDSYLISVTSNDFTSSDLDDCLTACDEDSCVGATYDNGTCHIAQQRLIGSVATEGSFAFIPLRQRSASNESSQTLGSSTSPSTSMLSGTTTDLASVEPSSLTPSAFPTGAFTIESYRTRTTASGQYMSSATPTCNTNKDTICNTCEELVDSNGEVYRMICDWQLDCDDATPVNTTTVEECMLACDEAPRCRGGYFPDEETQDCYLCPTFTKLNQPHIGTPTVAFYRADAKISATALAISSTVSASADLLLGTMPLTLTTITDRASWSSQLDGSSGSTSASVQMSPTSSAVVTASLVSCPAANLHTFALGDTRRPFTIFCDVAVYDQPYSIYSAESLLECATDCDFDCSAFEYVNGICQLFDDETDVVTAQGVIVGFAGDFGIDASEPDFFTAPGPAIVSLPPVSSAAQATATSVDPSGN